ncbi:hypothetical protein [Nonomuraea typhae]|uniref:Uncharacterized protein n=1 Tax=Nonomuraea typhae TaxID=2603600 RepID=A0ABW7Z520_9ACTN
MGVDMADVAQERAGVQVLVEESGQGGHVWFVPDLEALDDRLRAA